MGGITSGTKKVKHPGLPQTHELCMGCSAMGNPTVIALEIKYGSCPKSEDGLVMLPACLMFIVTLKVVVLPKFSSNLGFENSLCFKVEDDVFRMNFVLGTKRR